VNFQANVRFEGPTVAVEECAGSDRNVLQLLEIDVVTGASAGGVVGSGVGIGVTVGGGAVEIAGGGMLPIAHS
jgi:hypothetical protein